MKQPVHSMQVVQGQIIVRRLKEPTFIAIYNPDSQQLQEVQFKDELPYNADSLYKKAIAAVKSFLAQQQ